MLDSRKHILNSHVEGKLQSRLFKNSRAEKFSWGKILSNIFMFVCVSFVMAYTLWGFFN